MPGPDFAPGSVTLRTRYEDFVGLFVLHCHLLDHEDLGMMQLIEVV
jgi:FtsP/CotA-like multicopper oxidase with cupredoxin domain